MQNYSTHLAGRTVYFFAVLLTTHCYSKKDKVEDN